MRRTADVRTFLTERTDRAIDDTWIARADHAVINAQACRDARAERLDHDIGAITESQQRLATRSIFQVDYHALLAAVQIAKKHARPRVHWRNMASWIAFSRRLDLDHLGAMIGERHRQERPRQKPG